MMIIIALTAFLLACERLLYRIVEIELSAEFPNRRPYALPMWIAINVLPVSLALVCLFGYIVDQWSVRRRNQ